MRAVVAEALVAEALIDSERVTRVYTVEAGLAVVFDDGSEYTIKLEEDTCS